MYSGICGFEKGIEDACKENRRLNRQEPSRGCNLQSDRFSTNIISTGGEQQQRVSIDWKCIGRSEIDKYAEAIAKYHYPNERNYGDATRIVPEELPNFDCIVGGFPCQSFSIAGKRGAFSDIRGTLFFEICRIARVKKPAYLWLENVKGLFSAPYTEDIEEWDESDFDENGEPTKSAVKKHKQVKGTQGWVFLTILHSLWELGYDVQWQLLNSKHHGVPQNRERVFIIGHLRGQRRPEVFPIGETNEVRFKSHEVEKKSNQNSLPLMAMGQSNSTGSMICSTIDGNYGKGVDNYGNRFMIMQQGKQLNTVPSLCGGAHSGGNHSDMAGIIIDNNLRQVGQVGQTDNMGQRIYDIDGIACSQRANGGGQGAKTGLYDLGDRRIRRLTPIECERLQGFPDNWTRYGLNEKGDTIEISDSQRYKCCGNAVTTNVIKDIVLKWNNTV